MFERFEDSAIAAIIGAQKESLRRQHNYVDTEHILVGLFGVRGGAAPEALLKSKVTLKVLRQYLDSKFACGKDKAASEIEFTADAKELIKLAWEQAQKLGALTISEGHLLLAILAQHESNAKSALTDLGVNLDKLRGLLLASFTPEMLTTRLRVSHSPVAVSEIFKLAQKESIECGHNYVAPEQLLLGMLALKHGHIATLLADLSLSLEQARQYIKSKVPEGKDILDEDLPLTDAAKLILEETWNQAFRLRQNWLNEAHLLLAILESKDNLAMDTLIHFGIDIQQLILKTTQSVVDFDAPSPQAIKQWSESFTRSQALPSVPVHRFDEYAIKTIIAAQHEAKISRHSDLGTEHLLLGLLRTDGGIAQKVLSDAKLTLQEMRAYLHQLSPGDADRNNDEVKLTDHAKKALEESSDQARKLKSEVISDEHILLAILNQENGQARAAIVSLGYDIYQLEDNTLAYIANKPKPQDLPPPQSTSPHEEMEEIDETLWTGLTDRVASVLKLAQRETRKMGLVQAGTEHLLLALLSTGGGIAYKALIKSQLTADKVREQINPKQMHRLSKKADKIIFSKEAVIALNNACQCADELKSQHIGTEHLLLGILAADRNSAATVIQQLGQSRYTVIAHVLQGLTEKTKSGTIADDEPDEPKNFPPSEPVNMFDYFSEQAIKAIMLSQEEARRASRNKLGTEHILLGLMGIAIGPQYKVLKALGLTLKTLRTNCDKISPPLPYEIPVEIPFTKNAKTVLESAWNEARALGHNYIGPEHLMLGILDVRKGNALVVLQNLNVDLIKLRDTILKQL